MGKPEGKNTPLKAEPIWEDNLMDLKINGVGGHGLDH